MKITAIETHIHELPLKSEYHMISALGKHHSSRFVLIRINTNTGIEGLGEASIDVRWSGETAIGTCEVIENVLFPAIQDCEIEDIDEIQRRMDFCCAHNWFSKSAIEMACWDILGKDAGKPLYELLGGAVRPLTFRSRFSMGAYDVPRAQRRAQELIEMGFTTIKVKVGGCAEDDVARVRAVRNVIGFDPDLVIDANNGWSPDIAIDCLRALQDCRVDLVEQPTPKGDFQAMARVRRETGARILADDICFDLADAKELIHNDCCDCISVYPGKNGGIGKTIEIIRFAEQHGIPCSIGSNLEWDIGTAAMAHVVVSQTNMNIESFPGDVLGPSYHEGNTVTDPISIRGPLTTTPEAPGLGIGELTLT
ncbi:MAG: muconate cycloisomerase [Planctomycetes bacterium]|nr:muconate cycloisomerase [Planctomycetota bacterium]